MEAERKETETEEHLKLMAEKEAVRGTEACLDHRQACRCDIISALHAPPLGMSCTAHFAAFLCALCTMCPATPPLLMPPPTKTHAPCVRSAGPHAC